MPQKRPSDGAAADNSVSSPLLAAPSTTRDAVADAKGCGAPSSAVDRSTTSPRMSRVQIALASPRVVEKGRQMLHNARHKRIAKSHLHTLNPFEKFFRYGRFPCKFVLNVIIFALLTAFLLGCHVPIAKDEETQRKTLIQFFMPAGFNDPAVTYYHDPISFFGSIDHLRDFLNQTTQNYYAIVGDATADYNYFAKNPTGNRTRFANESDIEPPIMTAEVRRTSGRLSNSFADVMTKQVAMTPESPFGLFAELSADVKQRVNAQSNFGISCAPRMESANWELTPTTTWYQPCRAQEIDNSVFDVAGKVTVVIKLRSADAIDRLTNKESIYEWTLTQTYNLIPNGLITLNFVAQSELYRKADSVTVWLGILGTLIFFVLWDLLLRVRAFTKILRMRRQKKQQLEALRRRIQQRESGEAASHVSTSSTSSSLSTEDAPDRQRAFQSSRWKMDLQNSMGKSWTQWAIFVDLLVLTYATDKLLGAFAYPQSSDLRYTMSIVGGLAIFGNASMFLSYMRFFPKLYVLMVATNVALPHFKNFLVCVLPMYCGFALFGTIAFGDYAPEFGNFWEAVTSLYCAIFGDSLLQMFQVTGNRTNVQILRQIGYLYSACFISFFIYAVLNIATTIILGAYSYVNETYSLYSCEVERKVAPRKTIQEQLDEAVEQAQASLRRVALLMSDERSRPRSATRLGAESGLPGIVVDAGSTAGATPVDPMQQYLDEQVRTQVDNTSFTTTSTLGGGCRRRRGRTVLQAPPSAPPPPDDHHTPDFFTAEWVDRDVIF